MSIVSCGAGNYSSLGRKDKFSYPLPVQIEADDLICMGAGWRHNIIIYENGSAVGWGYNNDDQLGIQCREAINPLPVSAFEGLHLVWCHCGDKITAALNEQGEVYVIGSSYGRYPVRLRIPRPAIFCTCGVNSLYTIDEVGDIFICNGGRTGAGIVFHLPNPVCDIAAGNSFCLAVTITGALYAKGSSPACGLGTIHSSESFVLVASMIGIPVLRVFAHHSHSVVLTRDGRVFVAGSNSDGQLGLEDLASPLTVFTPLHFFDSIRVSEVDCGDSHTVFITEDGDVYGCGSSDDGRTLAGSIPHIRTPKKSLPLNGKASFVRCGCSHSIVLINGRRPIHPGLLHFGLIAGSIRNPKFIKISANLTIDVALGSITGVGYLPGDTVSINHDKVGQVIGVANDKVGVKIGKEISLFKKADISFVSRVSGIPLECVTRSGAKLVVDQNSTLCLPFGFEAGDEISHPHLGKGYVAGYANGAIWFGFDVFQGRVCRLSDNKLSSIFQIIRIRNSKRKLNFFTCEDGITYPVSPIESKPVKTAFGFGSAVGRIGPYICFKSFIDHQFRLALKKECQIVSCEGDIMQYDRVESSAGEGLIVSCGRGRYYIMTDESHACGRPSIEVSPPFQLLWRIAGSGEADVDGLTFSVGFSDFIDLDVLPGDIYASESGFMRVFGLRDGRVFWSPINGGPPSEIQDGYLKSIVLRHCNPCSRMFEVHDLGNIEVSIFYDDFAGMKYLPADEISLDGSTFVVLGKYMNLLCVRSTEESQIKVFDPKKESSALIRRPTSLFRYFL